MKTIETIDQLRNDLKKSRLAGQSIGFVPTMGYLHQGHLSLVEQSKKENRKTVVSIFVNPIQFGPEEDFDRYPRDNQRDEQLLKKLKVDWIFYPSIKEIYPEKYKTYVEVEKMGGVLCGKSRPTHFRGVVTVVLKLLNIVSPTRVYFGRKDGQQAIIIKKMVKDLNLDVHIKTVPIVRDSDGLALSSRNVYLSVEQRKSALCLSQALGKIKREIEKGLRDARVVKDLLQQEINKYPLVAIDYLEVVSLDDLEQLDTIKMDNTMVAGAIWVGKTRLIDNFILGEI
jgi:pantoate--beta-alanine ligase